MIAVDIETYDPNLKELGSGCIRCDGWILCVGTYDGHKAKAYVPGDNDWDELRERLASDEPKVFHNGIYDLGWLACSPLYNLIVNGIIHDTMTRAAFIDEYAELGLDACCKRMGVKGKNKGDTIEQWYSDHKKELGMKGGVWQNVLQLWQDVEGRKKMIEYNLQDCRATYNLFYAQEPFMSVYQEPYQMECDLYRVIIHMKKVGARIDVDGLNKLRAEVQQKKDDIVRHNEETWGLTPTMITSSKQLSDFMHSLDLHSPLLTPAGAESFNATALDKIHHPVVQDIQAFKAVNSLLTKYLGEDASMARSIWNGRIHCDFSPNKRDDGGTITGRFASSSPNLQNISAREMKHGQKTYGDEVRSLFIPEDNCWMFACDYSQIEYVLFMNFASGPQAEQIREQIRAGIDFHTATGKLTGIKERYLVKTINYGKLYGMGFSTMLEGDNYPTWQKEGEKVGMTAAEFCKHINDVYNEKLPVIGDSVQEIQRSARLMGYVKSIGGRRHHKPKPFWNPKTKKWDDGMYKMTNYFIQGSAAEVLKKALVNMLKSGLISGLGDDDFKLHLTIHDENVASLPKNKKGVEMGVEMERCMNMAYLEQLSVPIRAEGGIGDSWDAKHSEQAWQDLRVQYGWGTSKEMQKRLWRETGHTTEINTL